MDKYQEGLQPNLNDCDLNRLAPAQGYPASQQGYFNGNTVYPIVQTFPVIDTWNPETQTFPVIDTWNPETQTFPVIDTWNPETQIFPVIDTWNPETPEQPHNPEKKSLEERNCQSSFPLSKPQGSWTSPSHQPALSENAIRKLHHPHQNVDERKIIFDYIKTLQNKWLTGSILAFHTNKQSGTACYENKCSPYSIKCMFSVPQAYKTIPRTELSSKYKGINGNLKFSESALLEYIRSEQPNNFKQAKWQNSKRIPIKCENVELTKCWTLPEI